MRDFGKWLRNQAQQQQQPEQPKAVENNKPPVFSPSYVTATSEYFGNKYKHLCKEAGDTQFDSTLLLRISRREMEEWLDSQDFYELCQGYRHARDGAVVGEYEALKAAILARCS